MFRLVAKRILLSNNSLVIFKILSLALINLPLLFSWRRRSLAVRTVVRLCQSAASIHRIRSAFGQVIDPPITNSRLHGLSQQLFLPEGKNVVFCADMARMFRYFLCCQRK